MSDPNAETNEFPAPPRPPLGERVAALEAWRDHVHTERLGAIEHRLDEMESKLEKQLDEVKGGLLALGLQVAKNKANVRALTLWITGGAGIGGTVAAGGAIGVYKLAQLLGWL